jgi:hypothetical protein
MSWQFETNEPEKMHRRAYRCDDEDEPLCSIARDLLITFSSVKPATFHRAGYVIVYLANCTLGGRGITSARFPIKQSL